MENFSKEIECHKCKRMVLVTGYVIFKHYNLLFKNFHVESCFPEVFENKPPLLEIPRDNFIEENKNNV